MLLMTEAATEMVFTENTSIPGSISEVILDCRIGILSNWTPSLKQGLLR